MSVAEKLISECGGRRDGEIADPKEAIPGVCRGRGKKDEVPSM
jgi:hypothetical protein